MSVWMMWWKTKAKRMKGKVKVREGTEWKGR